MKFLKFFHKVMYLPTLAFGSACLVSGFISVFKMLMNITEIESWAELMRINNGTFETFVKPFTFAFFVIFVVLIVVLRLMGKGYLLKKHTPL